MQRYYFAYGSNLLPQQMKRRCPGARSFGRAELKGWRFNITKRGTASIVPDPDGIVHGGLWKVTPAHVHTLDLYEGVPAGNYVQRTVEVTTPEGLSRRALTYVCVWRLSGPARVIYMETAVLPGAQAFDLPDAYVADLARWMPRFRGRRKTPSIRRPQVPSPLKDTWSNGPQSLVFAPHLSYAIPQLGKSEDTQCAAFTFLADRQ